MKRIFLIFSISILFFSSGHCLEEKNDPNTWDFSRVEEGKSVKHTFTLKNDTDKTLAIKGVDTSCGCTASKINKRTLKPKESLEIEVSFNSKGYSGEVKQFVYVNTDDIDNPVIRLIIKAEVVKQ